MPRGIGQKSAAKRYALRRSCAHARQYADAMHVNAASWARQYADAMHVNAARWARQYADAMHVNAAGWARQYAKCSWADRMLVRFSALHIRG